MSTAAAPAAAAAPLQCLNALYVTTGSAVRQIDLTTRQLVEAAPFTLPGSSGSNPNQLGIGAQGATAIYGTSTSIVRYTASSEQKTVVAKPSGVGSGTVGAINPQNGRYYYGAYDGNTLNLYVYDPATTASTPGIVTSVTVSNAPGGNGDIAFDEAGRLYLVAGGTSAVALYRALGTIPTAPPSSGSAPVLNSVELSRGTNTGSTNGIAFASDGYLYISTGSSIRQLNPITGERAKDASGNDRPDIAIAGGGVTDLGTCAGPSTVTGESSFPSGPAKPGDTFTPVVGGGGQPAPVPGNPSNPGGATDPTLVLPGQPVTVDQNPGANTDPNNYVTHWECRTPDGALIASGTGTPGTFTPPTGTDGNSITCRMLNDLPNPGLTLTKTVSPTTFSLPGTVLTYSFTVTNVGNTILSDVRVTDAMAGLSAVTCTPAQGGTLLPAAPYLATPRPAGTMTCQATYTTTAADVLVGQPKVNSATAAGTPPTGQGPRTSSVVSSASTAFLAIPPTATNDSGAAAFNQTVTVAGSTNDTPGNGTINHALTVFTAPTATNGGKTLTTAQGTWNIQTDGTAVFTPASGYVGTTPAAQYRITDSNGQTATATVTAMIRPGPVANPNSTTTNQDQNAVLDVLANDVPGQLANGNAGTRDVTSVIFPTAGQPAGASVTDAGRTLTVPGQGVYTADPVTGLVTFDPAPTFTGTTTPVSYTFSDSIGNSATSTITVTVNPVNPVAVDDAENTVFGTAVTLPGSTNDIPGPGGEIDDALTVFTSGDATNGGKSLTTPEGTWEIQPDGTVVFDPATGYVGTTPPVEYRITDANGQTDLGTLTVTVRPGPSAVADTATTPQNVTVSFPILDDDTAGLRVDGSEGELDPASVAFQTTGLPAGSEASSDRHTLTVPGEGVYTWDPATELVTFDPEPAFTGVATPVTYTVLDQEGSVATSTITVTVTPITPTANDNAAKTPANTPVELNAPEGDLPGAPSAPLDLESVIFTSTDAELDGTRLVVAGEGTWTVGPQGVVTFTPEATFSGPTTAVEYSIADANGTRATADLTVVVGSAPLAAPDSESTPQNTPVELVVLTNDVAGDQGAACDPATPGLPEGCDTGTLVASSVVFPETGQPADAVVTDGGKTLTVEGEGVYTIADDGVVTFSPVATFTGPATTVTYAVTDSYGNTATSTISVTVLPITPVATDDQLPTAFNTPITLPGVTNDAPGTVEGVTPALQPGLTRFPTENQPATATVSDDGKSITVENEGTYVVESDGQVTFTPVDGFVGPTTPVTYRIEDANGTTDDAALSVVVRPGPQAAPNLEETLQGVPVSLDPAEGDTPGRNADDTEGTFDGALTVFPTAGQPEGAEVTDEGKTLTVEGEGVYTIDADGVVTFTPDRSFTGPLTTPVSYQVTDDNGNPATSTITISVTAIVPTALDDQSATPYDTPVTFPVTGNDVPGNEVAPIVASSATFEAADLPENSDWAISAEGKVLTVPGEGSWTLNEDGTVTFAPEAGFTGDTTSVTYTVRDLNGSATTAEILVTVQDGPIAAPGSGTTPQNVPVRVDVLPDGTPGPNADGTPGAWVPETLVFPTTGQPDGAEVSPDGKTLTVPGQGTYTVDPETNEIVFTPEPTFRGDADPISYTVTDTHGNPATGVVTIVVTGIDPIVTPDTGQTPSNTPVTIPGALNDLGGAETAPIVPGLTTFPVEGQPEGSIRSDDGKQLVVPGEGTWTVEDSGELTFTPEPTFAGETTPVTYQAVDSNGTPGTATGTVVVRPGPTAEPNTATTPQNVTVVLDVLTGDVPGQNADGTAGAWNPDSLVFPTEGQPEGATVSDDGKTLTVPGQGVYTVVPETNEISFDPEPAFRGVATPVTYAITDVHGNTATATVTITVVGIDPVATPDTGEIPFNTPVTIPGAQNDVPGADTAPIAPELTVFPAEGQPEGAEVSEDGKQLVVPGQGTWTVEPTGELTFTPEPTFVGTTTPVTYQVSDTNGTTDTATGTVTVRPGPAALPNSDTTPQNVDVTVAVLVNDTPGQNADGSAGDWVLDSVDFPTDGQPEGAVISEDSRTLVVPGQGVYTANPENGEITFDPEPAFRGPASPVTYAVTDTHGNSASATLTITVSGIDPVATDDAASTAFNTPVTLTGLLDDDDGAETAPLVPGATVFPLEGQPEGATVTEGGKLLTLADQGTFQILEDGDVLFTPVDGFKGTTTPVVYQIADANGTTDTATLTVTVQDGPTAERDQETTPQNVDKTITVLSNDFPGLQADGEPGAWDTTSVVFPVEGQPAGAVVAEDGKSVEVPGEGVYTVNDEGVVTFDPAPAFRGTTTPVTYVVTDSLGNPASSTIDVIVTGIDPVVVEDSANTPFNTPVQVPVLENDRPGAESAPLVPGSVLFPTEGQPEGAEVSEDGRTVVVPGQGTWTVSEDEEGAVVVVFTPEPGFVGTTSPVTYQVSDANGTTATAPVTVTVRPGPVAVDDSATTPQNRPVTTDVLGNDRAGDNADGSVGDLDPTSVLFPIEGQPEGVEHAEDGKQLVLPGVGTWTIDPETGAITFTPEPQFTGTAPAVSYQVTDNHGNTTTATLVVEVATVTPIATDDRATTRYNTPVTVDVLANDTAGSADAPLVASTLRLVDGSGELATSLEIPGEGTWTVVDGALVFTPVDGFVGVTSPVTYSVADSNGTRTTAVAVVEVLPTGGAGNDTGSTPGGTPVTVPVLDNDFPGQGETLDPGTVCVLVPGTADCVKEHTSDGVGTWVVNPDGTITFTPAPGFSGNAVIDYQVTDSAGVVYTATLTIAVAPTPPPLENTGFAPIGLLAGALVLLLSGRALVVQRRRRTA